MPDGLMGEAVLVLISTDNKNGGDRGDRQNSVPLHFFLLLLHAAIGCVYVQFFFLPWHCSH